MFKIDSSGFVFQRQNYCLNDFIGDVGGVFEVISFLVGIFMVPISRFAFIVRMLESNFKVFQAYSEEPNETEAQGNGQGMKKMLSIISETPSAADLQVKQLKLAKRGSLT